METIKDVILNKLLNNIERNELMVNSFRYYIDISDIGEDDFGILLRCLIELDIKISEFQFYVPLNSGTAQLYLSENVKYVNRFLTNELRKQKIMKLNEI